MEPVEPLEPMEPRPAEISSEVQLSLHRIGHDLGLGVQSFALRNRYHDVAVLPLPRDALPRRSDQGTVLIG